MFQRALVTGGAGFIGSHLVRALLREGVEVAVLDDLSMGKREKVPAEAEFFLGDVRSESDVRGALRGAQIVFHEAARVSIRTSIKQFYEDAEINLMGTLNLLRCCADSDVRKLLYASSMAVYADSPAPVPVAEEFTLEPIAPYGVSKLAGEKYCLQFARDTGIACNVLRYFNTYGTGQAFTPYVGVITIFVNRLLSGEVPTIFGDGEQRRDFVHVSDIVAANVLCMKADVARAIFNVGTGIPTSVNQIAELLCRRIAPQIRPLHAAEQPGELKYSIADIGRIAHATGYRPRATLEEKIGEVIESCRKTRAR